MKKKLSKILLSTLTVLGIVCLLGGNSILAAVNPITLRAQEERPYTDDNDDGTAGDDIYSVTRAANQRVFKIYQNTSYPDAIYCLRGGLGFGTINDNQSTGTSILGPLTYTKIGSMKNVDNTINTTTKEAFRQLINRPAGTAFDNDYQAIAWIADTIYLPRYTMPRKPAWVKNSKSRNESTIVKSGRDCILFI